MIQSPILDLNCTKWKEIAGFISQSHDPRRVRFTCVISLYVSQPSLDSMKSHLVALKNGGTSLLLLKKWCLNLHKFSQAQLFRRACQRSFPAMKTMACSYGVPVGVQFFGGTTVRPLSGKRVPSSCFEYLAPSLHSSLRSSCTAQISFQFARRWKSYSSTPPLYCRLPLLPPNESLANIRVSSKEPQRLHTVEPILLAFC